MTEPTTAPWDQPGWREQAELWIEDRLRARGLAVSGPIEQPHVRPWSTVLRVPTAQGDIYFKAVAPVLAHEVALTEALAQWYPDTVLPLLAADARRHWLLFPDGGTRLREIVRADHDLGHWERILPEYAALQMNLAERVPTLLALGVPDRRFDRLPTLYAGLLDDTDILRVGQPDGLTEAEYQRLRDLTPHVADLCRQLAAFGLPETLNHGDFHDGNIFLRDGRAVVFDWGDSVLSHPFYSLRTVRVSAEMSLGLDENDPQVDPLDDAYLAPWRGYASHEVLRAALALSRPLASLSSALGWYRVVSTLDAAGREAYAVPVPTLLQEFLSLIIEVVA